MSNQIARKMTLNLDVLVTEEIEEGVGRTRLIHPRLDGELYFIHSLKGGREEFLKALDESPISAILGVVSTFKDIANEASKGSRTASDDPSNGLPASTKNK